MNLDLGLDTYTRNARLKPALIVCLPVALAVIAWSPGERPVWGGLWGIVVLCGGTALLAEIARDQGKRKQTKLFAKFGGVPTTIMLRHRDVSNKITLQRRHKKLTELLPGTKLPNAVEERANPAAADEVYESCVAFLREKTRDSKEFPLVFKENCSYGFRRNLWGMKPIGLVTSVGGILAIGVLLYVDHLRGVQLPLPSQACGALDFLLLLGWIFRFTPDWVKIPAEAYAENLLAACELLRPPAGGTDSSLEPAS